MNDLLLTGYQSLQLLALGPCIFLIFFLCVTSRKPSHIIVPVLFFLSLSFSFCIPLLSIFMVDDAVRGTLLMGETLAPALIFLLVFQFISGRVPPLPCWAILAVPLLGGGMLVYATLINDSETCIMGNICLLPVEFKELYGVFSAALTLLLTIATFHRIERVSSLSAKLQKTTNALVFALIILNAALLAIELLRMAGDVDEMRADFSMTVIRIGFIYLALTSVFRVFDHSFNIDYDRVPSLRGNVASAREAELAVKVKELMTRDKIYRTMDISREKLAKMLAVTEHTLSRTVNICLGKSIIELINQYRVEEACTRLAKENTAITAIAFEVGFNSIPSFNRVFKLATGQSPSAYRATFQKDS